MEEKFPVITFDSVLLAFLAAALGIYYTGFVNPAVLKIFFVAINSIAFIPVLVSVSRSFREKRISVDLLAGAALTFSVLAGEWASAAFINLMLASARIFGRYTDDRARHAIRHLLKMRPEKARIKKDGVILEVPAGEVKKGDLAIVELGERIPVDGIIVSGEASVDQSSLTGESFPADKKSGDKVFSSTIVLFGSLTVQVEKVGRDTTFEKIIELVESAKQSKAKISSIADGFTSWYIIMSFVGSGLLYFFTHDINLVLAVLLVVCADDIAVAIPLTFLVAIGYGAKRGVIIKGANFIEGMANLKALVVDKTGTLTHGRLRVENFSVLGNRKPEEILNFAGIVCALSSHPSAKAIASYVKDKGIIIKEPEKFEEFGGKGAVAHYNGEKIATGKLDFFKELKFEITDNELRELAAEKEKGFNVTLVGYGKKLVGFFSLADELKPKISESISELRDLGAKRIVMLTGDNEKIAKMVAEKTGIKEYFANLLPEDKLNYLKRMLGGKKKVAMVGDGVNDAASLNLADIGIAMGAIGSDAAIESADIVLMKDDFTKLPLIIRLSKYALTVVRENFWIWGVVNAVGLALVFTGAISVTGAAAYNFLTDFIPFLNSFRLYRMHLEK